MINNIHYEEALNNILIVVIAAAVVLVLVMLLGSKKSRFRKKLSTFFADDTVERQNIRWNLIGNITSPEKRICGSLPRPKEQP